MCKGCGEKHDCPWGYCPACTAALLDVTRKPRIEDPVWLAKQLEIIRVHALGT